MLWLTEASAEMVRTWVSSNNTCNVTGHAAFGAALTKLTGKVCKCRKDPTSCPVHADACVTLADLMWFSSDAIFEYVPVAVSTLPLALTVKIAKTTSSASSDTGVPAFCRFMCKEEQDTSDAATTTWVPNNTVMETFARMRPTYLMKMILSLMSTLNRSNGQDKCRFADFTSGKLVRVCNAVLHALEAPMAPEQVPQAADILKVAWDLEALLTTIVADENEWSAGWTKFFSFCLQHAAHAEQDEVQFRSKLSSTTLAELGLEVPAKYRYLLGQNVKDELRSPAAGSGRSRASATPSGATASDADAAQAALADKTDPSDTTVRLTNLYRINADGSQFNVLDIMSLQHQLTSHFFSYASSPQRNEIEFLAITTHDTTCTTRSV